MTEKAPEWNPDFVSGSPLFSDLRALFPGLPGRWPALSELTDLLAAGLTSAGGAALSFHAQQKTLSALDYEGEIFRSGRVPTRARCWHDLFNALIWVSFPASKTRLNAIQVGEGPAATDNRRSRRRDLCTLVDECGVLVAAADPQFEALHRAHRWEHLFVGLRASWGRKIRAFIFGHGLYDQCLRPFLGLTGKAVYVTVDPHFFQLDLGAQYAHLDRLLERRLMDGALRCPADLLPLPILGVPGWHAGNRKAAFYRNSGYFR